MKIALFTISLQIFLISCTNNQNPISNPTPNDTSAGVRVEPEVVNSSAVNLNKVIFEKITFGGDIKQWNSYAAGYASKVQGVSLSEVNKEYNINYD